MASQDRPRQRGPVRSLLVKMKPPTRTAVLLAHTTFSAVAVKCGICHEVIEPGRLRSTYVLRETPGIERHFFACHGCRRAAEVAVELYRLTGIL